MTTQSPWATWHGPPVSKKSDLSLYTARTVIDNDNFSQVLDDAEDITSSKFVYWFDRVGRTFQVSAPGYLSGACPFNAHAASLISRAVCSAGSAGR